MAVEPQNFSNHPRLVAGFHGVLFVLIVVALGYEVTMFVRQPGFGTAVGVMLAVGLLLVSWYARAFAVTVQDRVIRLEERLRMARLLSGEMAQRIPEFSHKQLVALRFAPDAELPGLAKRVLDEQITDQKAIKRMIKEWRADYLRV